MDRRSRRWSCPAALVVTLLVAGCVRNESGSESERHEALEAVALVACPVVPDPGSAAGTAEGYAERVGEATEAAAKLEAAFEREPSWAGVEYDPVLDHLVVSFDGLTSELIDQVNLQGGPIPIRFTSVRYSREEQRRAADEVTAVYGVGDDDSIVTSVSTDTVSGLVEVGLRPGATQDFRDGSLDAPSDIFCLDHAGLAAGMSD